MCVKGIRVRLEVGYRYADGGDRVFFAIDLREDRGGANGGACIRSVQLPFKEDPSVFALPGRSSERRSSTRKEGASS